MRILVVEDSPVIALALEGMVLELGHAPLGPVGNMAAALTTAENEAMDAAIVDLNIRGTKAFSLLSVLARRGIPFIIVSGYADWKMPHEWAHCARRQKPFSDIQLRFKLAEILPS